MANLSPPRTFTRAELCAVTTAELAAFDPPTREAFEAAYWGAISTPTVYLEDFIQGDYDLIDTNRRFELGE